MIEMPAMTQYDAKTYVQQCLGCLAALNKCCCVWAAIRDLQNKFQSLAPVVTVDYIEGYSKPIFSWLEGLQKQVDVLCDSVAQIRQELAMIPKASVSHSDHSLDSIYYFKECKDVKNDLIESLRQKLEFAHSHIELLKLENKRLMKERAGMPK